MMRVGKPDERSNLIELDLRDLSQLFNSMDPSPFHEKDLDHDAEEFILSWADELHSDEELKILIHLADPPVHEAERKRVGEAVRHYFGYRAHINELEFKRLMKQGRLSLMIGSVFLGGCLLVAEWLSLKGTGAWGRILRESLTIGGWVAMWRPIQIYLYDWWPLKRRGRILRRLAEASVELVKRRGRPVPGGG